MTLPDLLHVLGSVGAGLHLRLVVRTPDGFMTPELREALKDHKPAIVSALAEDLRWEASHSIAADGAIGATQSEPGG